MRDPLMPSYKWRTRFYFRYGVYHCEGNGLDYSLVSRFAYEEVAVLLRRTRHWVFDLSKFEALFEIDNGILYNMQDDAEDTIILCSFEDRVDVFVRVDSDVLNPTAYAFEDFDEVTDILDEGNKFSAYYEDIWNIHVSATLDNLGRWPATMDDEYVIPAPHKLSLHSSKYSAITYELEFMWDYGGWSETDGAGQYVIVYNYPSRVRVQRRFK